MATNSIPPTLYQGLLLKLVTVLEMTQKPEGIVTAQDKQAVLQATNDFKASLQLAKELAVNLPGGELLTGDQDDVIDMLMTLRDRKREQLLQFVTVSQKSLSSLVGETKMEVDSMASTPANE